MNTPTPFERGFQRGIVGGRNLMVLKSVMLGMMISHAESGKPTCADDIAYIRGLLDGEAQLLSHAYRERKRLESYA